MSSRDDHSNLAEVDVIWRNETRGGGLWVEDERGNEVCLPLSRIEVHGRKMKGEKVAVVGPAKLLQDKGLI